MPAVAVLEACEAQETHNDIHKLQCMYIVHVPCFVSSFFGTIDVKLLAYLHCII